MCTSDTQIGMLVVAVEPILYVHVSWVWLHMLMAMLGPIMNRLHTLVMILGSSQVSGRLVVLFVCVLIQTVVM